jgi:hypothetical protein
MWSYQTVHSLTLLFLRFIRTRSGSEVGARYRQGAVQRSGPIAPASIWIKHVPATSCQRRSESISTHQKCQRSNGAFERCERVQGYQGLPSPERPPTVPPVRSLLFPEPFEDLLSPVLEEAREEAESSSGISFDYFGETNKHNDRQALRATLK